MIFSKSTIMSYFEVGDSMAYVSDVKNHDARTEGLSLRNDNSSGI